LNKNRYELPRKWVEQVYSFYKTGGEPEAGAIQRNRIGCASMIWLGRSSAKGEGMGNPKFPSSMTRGLLVMRPFLFGYICGFRRGTLESIDMENQKT